MSTNTEQPLFNYMVTESGEFNYYLYDGFDEALKKAIEISIPHQIGLVYEIYFNTESREYRVQTTFTVCGGKIKYDKHARVGLHLCFHVNAGRWLNPNDEWLSILTKKITQIKSNI
jgi:hypothetical protein